MIENLENSEILDYLMTSEFEGDYKPEELKYLLIKWRYFYRLLNGKFDLIKTEKEQVIKNLKEEIINKDNEISRILKLNADLKNEIDLLSARKLTWKERFKGKIIKDNEG